MYGLAAGAQIIAVQYNLAAKGRVFAYQSGFDPAWARTSPGAVLLAHSIREAVSEGAKEFDFLRHPEEFKYAWGAANRPNYRILLRSSFRVAGETAGSNP